MGTLPAWPVHAACELLLNETSKGVDILTAFKDLAGILYNDTSDCFDIYNQFIECADPTSCGLGELRMNVLFIIRRNNFFIHFKETMQKHGIIKHVRNLILFKKQME